MARNSQDSRPCILSKLFWSYKMCYYYFSYYLVSNYRVFSLILVSLFRCNSVKVFRSSHNSFEYRAFNFRIFISIQLSLHEFHPAFFSREQTGTKGKTFRGNLNNTYSILHTMQLDPGLHYPRQVGLRERNHIVSNSPFAKVNG